MAEGQQLAFGPFVLDTRNQRLLRGTHELRLRPKSFAVLHHLVRRAGDLVSKDELLKKVWAGTAVSDSVLKVCVREIRSALGEDAEAPRYVQTEPRRGYRFIATIADAATAPPRDEARGDPFATVVGRMAELEKLTDWLATVERGERKIIFVTGEAGVGKTTLIDLFVERAAARDRMRAARGQCLERHGQGEAYLPVLEALGRLCREPGGDRLTELLRRYAPTWLVQMPAQVPDTELEALQRRVAGTTHERMLREITEAIEALAAESGLVLVLEDLQWSDYSTLELISYLAHRRERVRLMLIGTYRPAQVALTKHPLLAVKQELHVHGQCEELAVGFLSEAEVEEYLRRRITERRLPVGIANTIHRRTEGNALYMVSLLDFALAEGLLEDAPPDGSADADALTALERGVPDSLRQMIEKQIDAVAGSARPLLEAASVAGPEFCAAAVAAGAKAQPEEVEKQCDGLATRGYLLRRRHVEEWPDGTVSAGYGFIHGFYHQVLYEQMGDAQRVRMHRLIGERKEAAWGERARDIAGELAAHFEHGRDSRRAIAYHRQAAANALARSADREAAAHLGQGLELLQGLPASRERDREELLLQLSLGPVLQRLEGPGAPESARAYERAQELRRAVGTDEPHAELMPALLGLAATHLVRGDLTPGEELAARLVETARRSQDPAAVAQAEVALGNVQLWRGNLAAAREHLESSLAATARNAPNFSVAFYPFDAHVRALSGLGVVLWQLGYPEQARRRSREALAVAAQASVVFDATAAQVFSAMVSQIRRDVEATRTDAEAAMAVAREHGFALFEAAATTLVGWAVVESGDRAAGRAIVRDGIAAWRAAGARILEPYLLGLLADACGRCGDTDEGLRALDDAQAAIEASGGRLFEPEVHRLRGELLLQTGTRASRGSAPRRAGGAGAGDAEACYRRAIDLARQFGAKSLELRAELSLARTLRAAGKTAAAADSLREIHAWFTEGFDTGDLRAAKAFLDETG